MKMVRRNAMMVGLEKIVQLVSIYINYKQLIINIMNIAIVHIYIVTNNLTIIL